MYEYVHGGNAAYLADQKNWLDLSANINPLGVPPQVAAAIMAALPDLSRYPDNFATELRQAIAAYEGVDPNWLFCGNGASDIIFRLPAATKASTALVLAPTFADYERALIAFGTQADHYHLAPQQGFKLDNGIIEAILTKRPKLLFICNPNNPTGVLTEPQLLQEICQACQQAGTVLAVDECFLDFTTQAKAYSCKNFLAAYPNLVILKAFTKLFALPGIRLGYAISSNPGLIAALYSHGADWPTSCLAQAAGIAALKDAAAFVAQTVAFVNAERQRLSCELAALGYQLFDSQANYLFLANPYPFDLKAALNAKQIQIRACQNYHGLNHSYYRIGLAGTAENTKLLQAITAITQTYQD